MDVCVENVFTTPPSSHPCNSSNAEEKDRAASSDPHHGIQRRMRSKKPYSRAFSPADSSEALRRKPQRRKNPCPPGPWLGLCRTRKEKCLFVGAPAAAGCARTKSARIPTSCTWMWTRFFASSSKC